MKTSLYLSLETLIEKWINNKCESSDWPEIYIYEDLSRDMAKASELIFDANCKGQIFAQNVK